MNLSPSGKRRASTGVALADSGTLSGSVVQPVNQLTKPPQALSRRASSTRRFGESDVGTSPRPRTASLRLSRLTWISWRASSIGAGSLPAASAALRVARRSPRADTAVARGSMTRSMGSKLRRPSRLRRIPAATPLNPESRTPILTRFANLSGRRSSACSGDRPLT